MSAQSLAGKTIAFSGTMNALRRAAAIAKAEAAGATVVSELSKKVDFVITGDTNVKATHHHVRSVGAKIVPSSSFIRYVAQQRIQDSITARKGAMIAKAAGRAEAVIMKSLTPKKAANPNAPVEVMPWESNYQGKGASQICKLQGKKFVKKAAGRSRTVTTSKSAKTATATEKMVAEAVANAKSVPAGTATKTAVTKATAVISNSSTDAASAAVVETVPTPAVITAPTVTDNKDSATAMDALAKTYGIMVMSPASFYELLGMGGAPATAPAVTAVAAPAVVAAPAAIEAAPEAKVAVASVEKKAAASGRSRTVTTSKKAKTSEKAMKGKTIAFTGTLMQMKRIAAHTLAQRSGAKVTNCADLSSLSLLVYGADSAAKRQAAKKLGVPLISEAAFISACKQ